MRADAPRRQREHRAGSSGKDAGLQAEEAAEPASRCSLGSAAERRGLTGLGRSLSPGRGAGPGGRRRAAGQASLAAGRDSRRPHPPGGGLVIGSPSPVVLQLLRRVDESPGGWLVPPQTPFPFLSF